ncbi:MAG: hypothetical protein M1836_004122 [Candelina mexicana]|nr:MAG: hypothetical protein M1836_004122 [Candelina mexicana]
MSSVNVLEYFLSKTQVDVDSLDLAAARRGGPTGPWTDATSNQAEVFSQITNPENAAIVNKAIFISRQIQGTFPDVTISELAVEVAVRALFRPIYLVKSYDWAENLVNGYHQIFRHINPEFDSSRIVMKVPGTYEGLKACRQLKADGIKTLATTVFTMEQAILAGEAGCVSISPFIHELKMGFDSTYQDNDPLLLLCVEAQQYYEQHSIPTRVKACSYASPNEILQLAGVAAFTIEPDVLDTLASMRENETDLNARSLFTSQAVTSGYSQPPRSSYLDDEAKYRVDFARSHEGKGQFRLYQAVSIFSDFQRKAELKMMGGSAGADIAV